MLDVIGTILVSSAIAVILTAIATTLPLRLSGRLVLAGLTGALVARPVRLQAQVLFQAL